MKRLFKPAKAAVLEAGAIIKKKTGKVRHIAYKGKTNPVTEVDRAVETFLVSRLRSLDPEISILGEESTDIKGSSPYRWVIDPLDGTVNYAHSFPFFCLSLGLEDTETGSVIMGFVYDPLRDELFHALRGKGAFLNSRGIRVSSNRSLSRCIMSTGFPYDNYVLKKRNVKILTRFLERGQGIRRTGSAALDLCYTACGRTDGLWEMSLKPWDVAAGWLIVTEAGGKVTDMRGREFSLSSEGVLATNGKIHNEVLKNVVNAGNGR